MHWSGRGQEDLWGVPDILPAFKNAMMVYN